MSRRAPWFYALTCHPVTRRDVLGAGAGLAGLLLHDRAWAAPAEDGKDTIARYATLRDDPWVVAHGVRAMGAGLSIQGGERAVSYLLERHLQTETVNGRPYLAFPRPAEGHQNMILKTLLEAGVPLDQAFSHGGQKRTLRDVATDARALLRFNARTTDRNSIAWSLIALTRTNPPAKGQWTNAWGETITLAEVVEAGFEAMEHSSRPLQEAKDRGVTPEHPAPIHGFTCGGTHLLYSLLTAVKQGYREREHAARVGRQLDLLIWRLGADVEMVERFYRRQANAPGVAWFELDAKLKFVGHAGECLALADRHGLHRPTAAQREQRRTADRLLGALLAKVRQGDLQQVAGINKELYRQLVGDTCHAYHGLHLA